MTKYGLTEERYGQLMALYDNDEKTVAEVVDDWTAESCNRGYDIFNVNGTGMLEVNKIDVVGAFEDDESAVLQAMRDGIKIIPVEDLPENFDRRYLGWIDTPRNRKAIEKYCSNKED